MFVQGFNHSFLFVPVLPQFVYIFPTVSSSSVSFVHCIVGDLSIFTFVIFISVNIHSSHVVNRDISCYKKYLCVCEVI